MPQLVFFCKHGQKAGQIVENRQIQKQARLKVGTIAVTKVALLTDFTRIGRLRLAIWYAQKSLRRSIRSAILRL